MFQQPPEKDVEGHTNEAKHVESCGVVWMNDVVSELG